MDKALPGDFKILFTSYLIHLLPYSITSVQRIWPVLDSFHMHTFWAGFFFWDLSSWWRFKIRWIISIQSLLIVRFFVRVWSYLAFRLAGSTLSSLHQGLFIFACTTCECFCQYKIQSEQLLYPLHAVPVHSTKYWLTGLNGFCMFGGISSEVECSSSLNAEVCTSAREWVKIFPCIFHLNTQMTLFLPSSYFLFFSGEYSY